MKRARLSFLVRLVAIVVGVVAILQLITYFAARSALLDSTVKSTRDALTVGVYVFAQSLHTQTEQLKGSVSVLVNDFGFREAVATHDAATIDSALRNQADRVGADRAMVIDRDGRMLADTAASVDASISFPDLLQAADKDGTAATNLVLNGVPYVFVVSTVKAPLRIGWVGMGFELNAPFALQIKRLTQLEVTFFVGHAENLRAIATTLDSSTTELLRDAMSKHMPDAPQQIWLGETRAMVVSVHLTNGSTPLTAILQLPMHQALEPYYRLSREMLWVALIGIALATVIATFVARRLTHSVRLLANASARISSGNYTEPVEVPSRDELGDLASAFNQMQEAVLDRERRVVFEAEHDRLTGLPNRSNALRVLSVAIDAMQERKPITILVFDINHFKSINDAFGHGVGDKVLCHVAERMRITVKHSDMVARLGNDEFLLTFAGVDKAAAHNIAQRLLSELAKPLQIGELHFVIDAHVGMVTFPDDGDSAEMLIRRADIALLHCKQESKNPLVTHIANYQQGWEEQRLRRLALVHDLQDAIEHGGLQLKFQPKLSLSNPNYLGAEALVRWQHATHGFIGPDEFIPLAENSGQIVELTRWVIDTAVAQIASWARADIFVKVSVNMSALDLLEDTLPNFIENTLRLHGVGSQWLCLELTESSIMFDVQRSMASLQRLRDLGLRLSVDDFGTGYSSLAQLKRLPIDELKIDKSFVLKLDQSEEDRVIVHSTIELGHNMGLEVVAEGVETEASRAILRDLNCDMVQGFLLAKPLSVSEFSHWLSNQFVSLTSSFSFRKQSES